jgi:hypothetical protein
MLATNGKIFAKGGIKQHFPYPTHKVYRKHQRQLRTFARFLANIMLSDGVI